MTDPSDNLADRLVRLRPVLLTLAETLMSPLLRRDREPSDLVQDTLAEAHNAGELLDGMSVPQVFGWLRVALRNNIVDAARQLATQRNDVSRRVSLADIASTLDRLDVFLDVDQTTPSQIVARNEQIAAMLAAMQELPDNQRQALILKHLRGCSLSEVAEQLNLSEPAVAGLLHRGRRRLTLLLKGLSDV